MSSRLFEVSARRVSEAAATMPSFSCAVAVREQLEPDRLIDRVRSALEKVRQVNAAWRDGAVALHDDLRVGVALPGPVIPVVGGSFAELAARDPESFTAAELAGATFTVWGLGLELDWLTPLLVPRQAAGLGVGRAGLTLVCDARVLTAADASAFLAAVAN